MLKTDKAKGQKRNNIISFGYYHSNYNNAGNSGNEFYIWR